jgi:hypothetical protein
MVRVEKIKLCQLLEVEGRKGFEGRRRSTYGII